MADLLLRRAERALGALQYRVLTSLARRRAALREHATAIAGVRVPYLARPARDRDAPVVLVHGFGADKESWLVLAGSLGRSRGLLIPDLPGHGRAGPIPPERAAARRQAEAVLAVLDHAGAPRAHLVGSSMGGGISLRFARDYPQRVASLTLIGSVGPVVEKSEVGLALDRGENPLVLKDPDDIDRLLALVAERLPPSTRAMRRHLGAERFRRAAGLAALFSGWTGPAEGDGVPADLASIEARTLVIHGALDRVVHPATGRALAERLPRARLVELPDVGHVPQLEAPRRVARELEAFFAAS